MFNCPMFFSSRIEGVALEGDNLILSFAAPLISQDQKTRQDITNVRIVMSKSSVKNMVEFLNGYLANSEQQQAFIHTEPEAKQ